MKLSEFIRHLKNQGCKLAKEGGKHSIWENQKNGKTASVPRHQTIKANTARQICKDLGIKKPAGN